MARAGHSAPTPADPGASPADALSLPDGRDGPLLARALMAIAAVIALSHLAFNTVLPLPDLHISALHFGMFGMFCALIMPLARPKSPAARRWTFGLDVLIGLAALGTGVYLTLAEEAFYARDARFSTADWIAAGVAIALAIEFARRATGWLIPGLIILAGSYVVLWGQWLDGVFAFPGLSLETLFYRSYFGTEGLFGPIARISWSFVFMFILFGSVLVRSGAGDFIIALARLAAGRLTGGHGLVAVFSSGLMGSVTGSAVANTVTTGVVTIPLMTRAGMAPRFAAGVEAAASTGGQLMPPVMGAGAFVMANFTQIPYVEIIAAAAVPALLYFLSVGFFVRIEARRLGLTPEPDPSLRLWPVLRGGWQFLLPLGGLVTLLIIGFTPTYAAGIATLAVIAASWLTSNPMGPRAVFEAALTATRTMTATAVLLIAVGLIVMVIGLTGTGNTVSLMINNWAGGSLIITLVLVALASLVLGMGLPVTAAYIVLAALSAPVIHGLMLDGALASMLASGQVPEMMRGLLMISVPDAMDRIGTAMPLAEAQAIIAMVPPELASQLRDAALDPAMVTAALLSAHMIVFWLSQDSNVTPPVCLAAFAAAGIAGTKPMATGVMAWRVAKALYIVPVLFAFTPLIGGTPAEIAWIAVVASAGLYAFSATLQGYLEGPLTLPLRTVAAACALVLLWPNLPVWADLAGLAAFAALFIISRRGASSTS